MAFTRVIEPPDRVLDHDHRGVDHQAEVDGTQGEEAGGDAEAQHAIEGDHHRQRDGQGDDHTGAQVAEEDEQDGDDQQAALEEVAAHRVDDVIHQFGAVVDHLDLDARWQEGPQLVELGLEPAGDRMRVLAHEQEAEAEHRLAAAVGGHRATADLVADADLGDIAQMDRDARAGPDHHGTDLLRAGHPPLPLHHQGRRATLGHAAADIDVAGADLLQHRVEG